MPKIINRINSRNVIDSFDTKSDESPQENWFNTLNQLYIAILYSIEYTLSFKKVYFPFAYLEKVKRKGENYTLKIILLDDFPLLFLAFSWQATNSVLHGISLIFLLISFWCVYEIGYYENDLVAEKYEQKPKLASTYHAYKQMMETIYPWLWSLILGWIGIILLNKAQGVYLPFTGLLVEEIKFINPTLLFFLSWMVFLTCVRYCFKIYNYLNKQARTWLYLILQSLRYYGFLWITSTNLIGISILFSHILSRSLLYIVYRYSGGNSHNWPRELPEKFLRCCIFIFLSVTLCFADNLAIGQSWQTWAILLWCIVRSQDQIRKTLSQFKPIFQDNSN